MKTKYLVASMLGIVILSLAVYSTLHSVNNIVITVSDESTTSGDSGFGHSMGVVLVIEHERDGEMIYRLEKDKDLCLKSLAGAIHYLMKGTDVEPSYGYLMTTGAQTSLAFSSGTYNVYGAYTDILIGTGTTAADYGDYKLETAVYSDNVEAIGYVSAGLEMNTTYVTTFGITGSYAITEAGLQAGVFLGSSKDMLWFRDVFPAINVVSGDILTVKYIMMFN